MVFPKMLYLAQGLLFCATTFLRYININGIQALHLLTYLAIYKFGSNLFNWECGTQFTLHCECKE